MQVYLSCPDCIEEQARHEASSEPPDYVNTPKRLKSYPVQLTNEISYEVKCDFGHSSAVLVGSTNHEILFEFGVHSILDGYYREAITSFAASLERFYEFASRSIAIAYGCPEEKEVKCWEYVAAQSERQLGAYIYLYAAHFKEEPRLLSGSNVKLRNASVHKGKIPTRNQAVKFGNEVLSIITEISLKLWQTIPQAAHKVLSDRTQISINNIVNAGGTRPKHVQSIGLATHGKRPLEEHLKRKVMEHSRNTLDKHRKIIEELKNR
ncbi:hypothetical protein [Pseudomonas peradeniyensis]|uniref:Apea-like HEPN domain-containing protein n=1 Tax=Pseudomonas peradeniyensis TaxID=2745488 RepID=A0ABT2V7A0_9PSED|nr:hypothetical protein [Pseudomonas peradeniyensis]MCU7237348.1 hypothetical protein [Pseudomonas peradeniyensis]